MALYYPDRLTHNNTDLSLIDSLAIFGGFKSIPLKTDRLTIPKESRQTNTAVSWNNGVDVEIMVYIGPMEAVTPSNPTGPQGASDLDWENDTYWQGVGGGSQLALGSEDQVPFMNSDGSNFEYSNGFTWDDERLVLKSADSGALNIGELAGVNGSGSLNVGIGFKSNTSLSGSSNVSIGRFSGSHGDTSQYPTGEGQVFMNNNVSIGASAGYKRYAEGVARPACVGNVSVGTNALEDGFGSENVAFGFGAGNNSYSETSVFIGYGAGRGNYDDQFLRDHCLMLGPSAGENPSGDVYNSVYIGSDSGKNSSGIGNVFIGNESGKNWDVDSKLIIDNKESVEPFLFGDFDLQSFRINGSLEIRDVELQQTNDVLFYDPTTGKITRGVPPVSPGSGGSIFFDGGRSEEVYLFEDTIECGSSNDIQNIYIDCGESIRIL